MISLYEVAGPRLRLHFHPGQWRAWESTRRIVAIIAGSQSGKTSFLPLFLWREMQQCGPGDYGFISPTFALMELRALPEFKRLFVDTLALGDYVASPVRKFVVSDEGAKRLFGERPQQPTTVYFGYAENPDSLESSTLKAAVLDEAGQRSFKRESWEAVLRRLAIHRGRAAIGTTPYSNQGWLRTEIYDRWRDGDPDIDVIQFNSIMNPAFPKVEYERARATLPAWKFALFYTGAFTRPAGLVYDCFDSATHTCPRFAIPPTWPRHLGLDFGGVHTAGVFFAEDRAASPPRYYAYREYLAGGRTAKEHAVALMAGEPGVPNCVGGSKSEGQWRQEFAAAGLPVRAPTITDVEVGIDRVYGGFKTGQVIVFDDMARLLDEIGTYSRPTDAQGNPLPGIEDKESYHELDASRYILGWVLRVGGTLAVPPAGRRNLVEQYGGGY
jgi:hypothetical protein